MSTPRYAIYVVPRAETALYRFGASVLAWSLERIARRGTVHALPVMHGWFAVRDFPAPQGKTFQQQWRARK